MARIAGDNVPDDKKLCISLTYIYGIGLSTARKICKIVKIDENKKVSCLTVNEIEAITSYINQNELVSSDLRREVHSRIQFLKDIGTHKGMLHRRCRFSKFSK